MADTQQNPQPVTATSVGASPAAPASTSLSTDSAVAATASPVENVSASAVAASAAEQPAASTTEANQSESAAAIASETPQWLLSAAQRVSENSQQPSEVAQPPIETASSEPPQSAGQPAAQPSAQPVEQSSTPELLQPANQPNVQPSTPESSQTPSAEPAQNPTAETPSAETPATQPPTDPNAKRDILESVKEGFLSNLDKLSKSKEKIVQEATQGKSAATKMSNQEKKDLMAAEKIYQEGIATIRDLIAPSSMEIRYDMLQVGGVFAQTFYVFSYPRYLDTNWLSPIVNFEVSMDIAQFIYPIDSASIMKTLKKKVAQMQSSIRMDMEKGKVRDPALETALQDAEELRTEIQRGQEKFFQFALYFTIYSEDEKKLQKIAKQLEGLLGGKLVLTRRSQVQAESGFNSTLPLCLDELYVIRNMNTSPLSSTFPFSSSTLTANAGILYGVNRHNDSLIIFDRFSLENANSVVFAKSGAGKSYAVKLEILRQMMLGSDVIVIDPENEYESLAETVGGSYLRLSLNSDRRINPFDLPPPLSDEMTQPGDILRQNIITLLGLLKLMFGAISPTEESLLDRALIDTYSIKGITMDLVDPSQKEPPTMEDLYSILSSMEGGQNLTQRLQKFTSGTYGGIFNKPTNIDLTTGMMVFCIRDLDDALRPIAMYIILNYIWSRVRRELRKRLLIIDEAWSLMQHEDSAKFLFGLVKRARKYFLGITTITQDVEDFMASGHGKAIITNSSMQLLLKQAPAAIEVLAKTFNLTEGEKYILLNSGVGQGLFFAGNKHAAIQIIASYGEDKIVTTNPQQILEKKQEAEKATEQS